MPLSDDQRALLRLLAQREEGYGDIAALMGLSVDEVRSRVKGALNALDEGESAAGPVVGRGSSSSRDDAAGEEPRPTPPAAESSPPPRRDRSAPSKAEQHGDRPGRRSAGARLALPQGRRLWELIGGAVVVLLIVLFATGAIDIGGDGGSDDSGAALQGSLDTANGKLTQAALEPEGDGDGEGQALFGRLGKRVVLQVLAQGLAPSAPGENYAIWLYRAPKLALRVGAVKVGENGKLAARFPVPTELLALVASGSFREIKVSQTANAAYQAEVAAARRDQRLPRYTGETVLSGDIEGPLVQASAESS